MTRAGMAGAAVSTVLGLLAMSLSGDFATAAQKPALLERAAGARVGVVNLLDPEVTHFHAARQLQNSVLQTSTVGWPVSAMLMQALREGLTQMGLTPVAAAPTEALARARESCFLNAALAKGLPKACGPLYGQLAAAEHLEALIVLGPGLNDSTHAGGIRRRGLPEYLRGWCIVSEEGVTGVTAGAPALLNLTELLLIGVTASGGAERRDEKRLAVGGLADDAHPLDRRLEGLGPGLARGRRPRGLPLGIAQPPVVVEVEAREERALILLPFVQLRERRGARIAELRARAQLAHDAQPRSDAEQALRVAPVARVQQGDRIPRRPDRARCRAVPDVAHV